MVISMYFDKSFSECYTECQFNLKFLKRYRMEKLSASSWLNRSLLETKDGCGIDADCVVPLNRRPTALPASHGEMTWIPS